MPIITRAGLYGTLLGHPDQVLKDPAKLDAEDGKISLGPVGDFLDRVYHNAFHKKPEGKKQVKGAFPAYAGAGTDDIAISAAYRMLLEDARRDGFDAREFPLEDIRRRGYEAGLDYDVDELEYGNVIEIGSTLPLRRKFEVLAHGYAAKMLTGTGKRHVHHRRGEGFADDEFFRAGREMEKEYAARADAALNNYS